MSERDKMPELKQVLGAMIFAAKRAVSLAELRRCLKEVAAEHGEETSVFAEVTNAEIRDALAVMAEDMEKARCGFVVSEVAGGYRLQSDAVCGRWLRHLLAIGKPTRLSRPGLETLAIIAYRQPVARSEIEIVRGVGVDHIIKTLMEMQLVRIAGRSELPGRPLLYGTTQTFLEHFGLKSLKDLNELEPMLLAGRERVERTAASVADAGQESAIEADPAAGPRPETPHPSVEGEDVEGGRDGV